MVLPETRSMQAAIVLAEELNFSRAAERMHVEQSTLSRLIAKLESDIGLQLFVRNHQNVAITEAGRRFVEEAHHSVLYAERAVLNSMAASHGAEEILNIGKSAYYADPYLVTTLQSIRLPLYPGLKIRIQSHYSHELARMVATGELDMALVTAIPDMPTLDFLTLVEMPFYVALSKANPLASLRELTLEDLHGVDWIILSPHVNPHALERLQKAAAEKMIAPAEMHHVMTIEEASAWILEYDGVAILPCNAAWQIALDGITMRPLAEKDINLSTRLATRVGNKSRLASEFIHAIGRRQRTLYSSPQ